MAGLVNRWRSGPRAWIVLAAAYLFAFQAVLASQALAANAAPVAVDFFGGVICSSDMGHAPDGGSGDHSRMPGCCVLGCSMFGQALAPASDVTAAAFDRPWLAELRLLPADAGLRRPEFRTPRQSRAPPQVI